MVVLEPRLSCEINEQKIGFALGRESEKRSFEAIPEKKGKKYLLISA